MLSCSSARSAWTASCPASSTWATAAYPRHQRQPDRRSAAGPGPADRQHLAAVPGAFHDDSVASSTAGGGFPVGSPQYIRHDAAIRRGVPRRAAIALPASREARPRRARLGACGAPAAADRQPAPRRPRRGAFGLDSILVPEAFPAGRGPALHLVPLPRGRNLAAHGPARRSRNRPRRPLRARTRDRPRRDGHGLPRPRTSGRDRRVAVKILRPDVAVALGPERFLREIEIASRLSHPHILPVHDSGDADGLLYYVMPYVEGESLRERLAREGRLPVEEALRDHPRGRRRARPTPTGSTSSTATSSPATSCSRRATRSSPTSASPAPSAPPRTSG